MVAHALSFPAPTPSLTPASGTDWVGVLRLVLIGALLAGGALLTVMVLVKLGPVAYGLPAPFFRRRPAAHDVLPAAEAAA